MSKKKTQSKSTYAGSRAQAGSGSASGRKFFFWVTAIGVLIVVLLVVAFHPKSPTVKFDYASMPMLGKPNAPVKIVEMGDFKCPACQYFSEHLEPLIKRDYIDKGVVDLYFSNFTIIGPDSYTAALAGESIYHQNPAAFWTFYTQIYQNQGDEKQPWATPDYLTNFAKQIKLPVDYAKLRADIDNKAYAKQVDAENNLADKLNIQSTPTIFINGVQVSDKNTFNYQAIQSAIQKAAKG